MSSLTVLWLSFRQHFSQCSFKSRHRTVHIVQFVNAEQPQAEGFVICWLVALQRHAGGDLQALFNKFFAVLDGIVGGVVHGYAGRLVAFSGDANQAFIRQQRAYFLP